MRNNTHNNRNSGFSMVEMMAAVAILIILLGISSVAAAYYVDYLKITELDNAAREIYMAAENRAGLLSSNQRLERLVDQGGNQVAGGCLIAKTDANMEDLLPSGTIDPALWDGDFYILYDAKSGCVTDVFYAEETIDGNADFAALRNASRDVRMRSEPMLGYYGGGKAEGSPIERLHTPGVTVLIRNEEKLTVEVNFEIPASAAGAAVTKSVKVLYNGREIELLQPAYSKRLVKPVNLETGTSFVWILDSLEEEEQFQKLIGGETLSFDQEVTVTASVELSMPGKRSSSAEASDTNHPLFDRSSDGETAKIKYLRHLQNLNCAFSNSTGSGELRAVQTANIACCSNTAYPDYSFLPIENEYLISYDGRERDIRDLYVDSDGNAGLFGSTTKDTAFQNIRLINATVKTSGDYAGALLGFGSGKITMDNCWVYWEPTEQQSLMDLLVLDRGTGEGEYEYNYRISGKMAGGLAGGLEGDSEIKNSLAATLVSGKTQAGGLAGVASGKLTVTHSYADNYLEGKNSAGLVGMAKTLDLTNCYAAGFINMSGADQAAGLCLGVSTVHSQNVYSIMRYTQKPETAAFYYLTQTQENGSNAFNNSTYYLDFDLLPEPILGAVSCGYAEMTDSKDNDFAVRMGNAFVWKTSTGSHPYQIRWNQTSNNYDFPGLLNMPHYGDWTAEFKEPSLVYYEKYKDQNGVKYGFSGGNARYLVGKLDDDKPITLDGYAVAMLESDLDLNALPEITYTYNGQEMRQTIEKADVLSAVWENKNYYLIPLPEALTQTASEDFYQYLKFSFQKTAVETAQGEYFFNPHFAETVEPVRAQDRPGEGWTEETIAQQAAALLAKNYGTVSVRTPRHLYELSENRAYYRYSKTAQSITFQQDLDLNYATYTDYESGKLSSQFRQTPIGNETNRFRGTYNGGGHTIRGVVFKVPERGGATECAGLFGCSEGNLYNIVYQMDLEPEQMLKVSGGDGRSLYLGSLVGWNAHGGSVMNCSARGLRLGIQSYYAKVYLGGLAGQNNGVIRACAVESPELKGTAFSYGDVYMGGFIGWNNRNGLVETSYGVGCLSGEADSTAGVRVCGFVGYNEGRISNSYAAARLWYSGEGASAHGFCGRGETGSLNGAYYLNRGNFTYWDAPYAANYEDSTPGAVGLTYEELSAQISAVAGMGQLNQEGKYPYPTAVRRSGALEYPGEEWPKPMALGQMGLYYWEKMVHGKKISYHVSILAVDPEQKTITKQSTLSDSHADGSVVEEYGYGYYTVKDHDINGLSTDNIYYSEDGSAGSALKMDSAFRNLEDQVANEQLGQDFFDQFVFHSYRTRGLEGLEGLYPVAKQGQPNGTLTLTEGGQSSVQVTFTLNPFFADAMSVEVPAGWTAKDGVAVTGKAGQDPGQSQNPYEVRAINQLQFINWNAAQYNTTTVMTVDNYGQFPYLSSGAHTAGYYWQQSHDMMGGRNADGSYKTYTPIAEYYDATNGNQGNLKGWFGGYYNGDDYVIENVNIEGQQASCAGLFGVVYQGTLRSIVLYSSDGAGVISTKASDPNNLTKSRWYAMGALAGMVGDSTLENCSVAGYTIQANVYTYGNNPNQDWGGNNVGGLVGSADMDLSGCTAVVNIVVDQATENDNMRVGGLVGACQGSITNCYVGGSIQLKNINVIRNDRGIYVGGVVGGSYFKPLGTKNGEYIGIAPNSGNLAQTNNSLTNCYSYMEVPKHNVHGKLKTVYAIGGTGEIQPPGVGNLANHGVCTITNSYALGEVLPEESSKYKDVAGYWLDGNLGEKSWCKVEVLTYEQLAGQESIPAKGDKKILELLTAFQPVTPGSENKYSSYPPGDRLDLQGLDYPFPTILTRENGAFKVHYGQWPLNGIKREDGGRPIELDLFAKDVQSKRETLSLSKNVTDRNGTWAYSGYDETIIKVEYDGPEMTVTGLKAGMTTLLVTYTEPGGREFRRQITVSVSADLRLVPTLVTLYTSDKVTIAPEPSDRSGVLLEDGELKLTAVTSSESVKAEMNVDTVTEEDGVVTFTAIDLSSGEAPTEAAEMIRVEYIYTRNGEGYTGTSSILVEVKSPPEAEKQADGSYTITFDQPVTKADTVQDVEVKVENGVITLIRKPDTPEDLREVTLQVTQSVDGWTHTFEIKVEMPPEDPEEPKEPKDPEDPEEP